MTDEYCATEITSINTSPSFAPYQVIHLWVFCRGLDLAAERLEGRLVAQWSEVLCRQFGCQGHEIYHCLF